MDAVVEARAALYEAVCKGNWSECNALLAEGTPPNFFVNGTTPLHAAAQRGRHAFLLLLLEHGADTQATDPHGFTALQCFQERHRVWGNTLMLATTASGNAHAELRELHRRLHSRLHRYRHRRPCRYEGHSLPTSVVKRITLVKLKN